jgi:hypothetical protein
MLVAFTSEKGLTACPSYATAAVWNLAHVATARHAHIHRITLAFRQAACFKALAAPVRQIHALLRRAWARVALMTVVALIQLRELVAAHGMAERTVTVSHALWLIQQARVARRHCHHVL